MMLTYYKIRNFFSGIVKYYLPKFHYNRNPMSVGMLERIWLISKKIPEGYSSDQEKKFLRLINVLKKDYRYSTHEFISYEDYEATKHIFFGEK